MSERKSTGAGRILAVLAALLVLYVVSFGPVFGWTSRHWLPVKALNAIDWLYWPLESVAELLGVQWLLYLYANLWL